MRRATCTSAAPPRGVHVRAGRILAELGVRRSQCIPVRNALRKVHSGGHAVCFLRNVENRQNKFDVVVCQGVVRLQSCAIMDNPVQGGEPLLFVLDVQGRLVNIVVLKLLL